MPRSTYHHGDLRRSLVTAALDLVRSDGPDAVTVRELARRLDVSPAAIYRHFPDRDAVLAETARHARERLARRMLEEVHGVRHADPRARSVRRFLAVGRAYLAFAREEPNLLRAAFLPVGPHAVPEDPTPWSVLATALDDLVATRAMPPDRRPGAEVVAWSAVHGFATLRESHSFEVSGAPDPDEEALLRAIARSLDVEVDGARGVL